MVGWSGPGSAGRGDPPAPARECVPHRAPAPHLLPGGPHLSAPAAYTLPPAVVTVAAGHSVIPGTWWLKPDDLRRRGGGLCEARKGLEGRAGQPQEDASERDELPEPRWRVTVLARAKGTEC
ncbi:hypothetical protein E2C01_052204 [Portunus trituberculatus]|uniref:Uncharacterized protein n=1 Tax=Portunus trituberculatus TaxID=210409 RepID=A0A5B7GLQ2_PORTR|nr:hypothetical protein [Portunus trituberculatus]